MAIVRSLGLCYDIPNKFFDVLLPTFGSITEVKLAVLFMVKPQLHTAAGLARMSGQSKGRVSACLQMLAERGLLRQISLAPKLNLIVEAGRCAGCNLEYPLMDRHHIQPRAKGGDDTPENLVELCPNCHRLIHLWPWELTAAGREWLGLEATDPIAKDKVLDTGESRKQRLPLPQPNGPKGSRRGHIRAKAGHIYVLRCRDRYKIGRSVDVKSRLSAISHRLPFETEVMCIIASDDTFFFEAELHRRYNDKLVEDTNEWFFLDKEDVGHLKELANGK